MPGCEAAKSEMAEFWHIHEGFEEAVKKHFAEPPEADVSLDSLIPEKDFNSAGKGSADVKNLLKRLGVNPEILRRVAVAAYEAEINVAAHSSGGAMLSHVYPDLIHMIFQDNGPGIGNIEQAMAIQPRTTWSGKWDSEPGWACPTSKRTPTRCISVRQPATPQRWSF